MLKDYASYFVSYLLHNLRSIENIQRIILFGSVAKGEETKESDIDIFIEVDKITKKIEDDVKKVEEEFYQSREASLFKVRGIGNVFNIKIGRLVDWKDLSSSIASTGIILYGFYESRKLPSDVQHQIIFFWDGIEKNRGAFLNKIYGFKIKGRRYEGLLEKYQGIRLGKSCIMLPVQYKKEIFNLLHKHKTKAKVIEIFR